MDTPPDNTITIPEKKATQENDINATKFIEYYNAIDIDKKKSYVSRL